MAIGSSPEIGVTFYKFGDISESDHHLWYERIAEYGPDLCHGYGVVQYAYHGGYPIPPLALVGPRVFDDVVAKTRTLD